MVVINTSHETAICIEAKFESGEGKHPSNISEREVFKKRGLEPVGQLSIQNAIMEKILGLKTEYIFLVQKNAMKETHKTWTWKEVFEILDTSTSPYFMNEWLKRL